MKKYLLLITNIFLFLSAYNQIITGTVIDKKTSEKVGFASIYFDGTFVGTSSDINGNFKLDISNNTTMSLTISCIGYYSTTLNEFSTEEPLLIYLKPKAINMEEIVVSGKSLVRKKISSLRLFKKEFLGSTINGLSCDIINEEDITFNYGSDRDTLKAFALKPIQIINKALGYRITYYLDKFEYCRESKSFLYEGNIIFDEDLALGEKTNKEQYEEKRRNAYLGSRMHFLRALWANNLEASGFIMRNPENKDIDYRNLVVQEAGNIQDSLNQYKKFISYPFPIAIYYHANLSTITLLKQRIYFDKNGSCMPGIIWEGVMSTKRIGDTLPFEYKQSNNNF